MKHSRRMTRLSRFRPNVSRMNLTSLMDVFTILVFFLVMNSGPTEVLDAGDLVLPAPALGGPWSRPGPVLRSKPKLDITDG